MTKAKRWKPKEGERHWVVWAINHRVLVIKASWRSKDNYHKHRYRLGNCFKTKREAQAVARKLKAFWKDVREGR